MIPWCWIDGNTPTGMLPTQLEYTYYIYIVFHRWVEATSVAFNECSKMVLNHPKWWGRNIAGYMGNASKQDYHPMLVGSSYFHNSLMICYSYYSHSGAIGRTICFSLHRHSNTWLFSWVKTRPYLLVTCRNLHPRSHVLVWVILQVVSCGEATS